MKKLVKRQQSVTLCHDCNSCQKLRLLVKQANNLIEEAERTMEITAIEYRKLLVQFRKYILKITKDRQDFREWLIKTLVEDFMIDDVPTEDTFILDDDLEEFTEGSEPTEQEILGDDDE